MSAPLLPKRFPENVVFIIDGLVAAYTVAMLCAGRSIKCIYETKEIGWRKANMIALYDLLLSDVQIKEKRTVHLPHPFFFETRGLFKTVLKQKEFIADVRRQVSLDSDAIYCGCITSSLLLGYKDQVAHVLMDEGMSSIIARHRLHGSGRAKWLDLIREKLAGMLIPFRFRSGTPQITMARDAHHAIVLRKDYREFHSSGFNRLIRPLVEELKKSDKNVLALVKGPPHVSNMIRLGDLKSYVDFNVEAIKRFIAFKPEYSDACFYLKMHPSLGLNSPLEGALGNALSEHSIRSKAIGEGIEFDELPSIPAEAYLSTGEFEVLLSLDVSSSVWHVGHDTSLSCYMPLNAILQTASEFGYSDTVHVLAAQQELNRLNGNHVIFY